MLLKFKTLWMQEKNCSFDIIFASTKVKLSKHYHQINKHLLGKNALAKNLDKIRQVYKIPLTGELMNFI